MIPVTVLGAGVIGLTTALELKKKFPRLDITVAAASLPGDINIFYTSPFAGANWLSVAKKDDTYLQDLDREAYYEFLRLADDPCSGIWRKKNALYYTLTAVEKHEHETPWFAEMAGGRVLETEELLEGAVHGFEFDGVVVSVPIYLSFLLQKCLGLGITVRRVSVILHIEDARQLHHSGQSTYVVNCTGIGVTGIKGTEDPAENYPIRGQVLLVRNTLSKAVVFSGFDIKDEELYAFPRKEGGAIIGGSFSPHVWQGEEDQAMTLRLTERALQFLPELTDPLKGNPESLEIVSVNVGLRPARSGGPRIERDKSREWLIHCYGAGGGGYQGSYGFARQVCRILGEAFGSSKL